MQATEETKQIGEEANEGEPTQPKKEEKREWTPEERKANLEKHAQQYVDFINGLSDEGNEGVAKKALQEVKEERDGLSEHALISEEGQRYYKFEIWNSREQGEITYGKDTFNLNV